MWSKYAYKTTSEVDDQSIISGREVGQTKKINNIEKIRIHHSKTNKAPHSLLRPESIFFRLKKLKCKSDNLILTVAFFVYFRTNKIFHRYFSFIL